MCCDSTFLNVHAIVPSNDTKNHRTVYFFKDGCGDFDPANTTQSTGVDELTSDTTEGCENAVTSNYHSVYVDGIKEANMNLELYNDDSCMDKLNNLDPTSVIKEDGCYTAPISVWPLIRNLKSMDC